MAPIDVIYSVGAPLGEGLGGIASFAASGIARHHRLKKLLAPYVGRDTHSSIDSITTMSFPAYAAYKFFEKSHSNFIKDSFYDAWASRHIDECRIFYGWAHMSLYSLRAAGRAGAKTVIDRGSAEIRVQKKLLEEESRRLGLTSPVISGLSLRRQITEEEEVDLIAVPSRFVFDSFMTMGFPEKKLFINPLGVDIERFRSRPIPEDGCFRALYMGMLSVQKGVHYLLQAWEELGFKDAELHLVGKVLNEIKPFLARAQSRGLKVFAGGGTHAPEKAYEKSHIFILPSIQDGFGSVVLEAMASGRPVIVTENVGAKDCVREGMDGFIVPVGSPEALGEKIKLFYEHREKVGEMGTNARKRAEEYTWEAYQERLVARLEGLCNE